MLKSLLFGLLLCVPVQAERGWKNSRREAARQVEPVATTKWLGSTSTDWNTAGNWSNGIPANNDTVLVDSSAGRDLLLNVDRTGDNAGAGLKLTLFHIHKGTTVAIGASGAPLKLTTTTFKNDSDDIVVYFTSQSGTGNNTTSRLLHTGQGGFAYGSAGTTGKGTIGYLSIAAGIGTVTLAADDATDRVTILDGLPSPAVTFEGGTAVTSLDVAGGDVTISQTTGALTVSGGTVTNEGAVATFIQHGGVVYWNTSGTLSGFAYRGTADLTQTAGEKTVNTLFRNINSHGLVYDPLIHTVTNVIEIGE